MGIINDLFRTHGPAYVARYGETMPSDHRKVISAMIHCRTEDNGTVIYRCEDCHADHARHRACGNRHCPGCQQRKTYQWLDQQIARQLPGHHFMLTFTVPEPLRTFLRSHQRAGYSALFEASAAAIKTLAAKPKFFGTHTPGFFGVLHTWGRQLHYHPHIHYLVPGGALSIDKHQWQPASPGFYLPVKALSKRFRAKFRDRMKTAGLLEHIPAAVWQIDWNVHCQPVGTAEATLNYLAPYVFKVAISDQRIVKIEAGKVTFRYKKSHSQRLRTMTLEIFEFIRRFLQHVLPTGFMKVRYYGFLSPTFSVPIEEVQALAELAAGFAVTAPKPIKTAAPKPGCRHCGGVLRYLRSVPRPRQIPTSPEMPPVDRRMPPTPSVSAALPRAA